LIVLGSGISTALRSGNINSLSERIAFRIRNDYFNNIINKDIAFFDERRTGDLCKLNQF